MAYSTPAQVRKALVPSSDGAVPVSSTHTAADLSDTQLIDAIVEADATIDGYLGRLYTVPVPLTTGVTPAVPHPVDYWSRNIAVYNATLAYRGSQDISDQDPVVRRYTATMQALQAVGAGTTSIEVPRNRTDTAASGAAPAYNPNVGDLFGPDDWTAETGLRGGGGYNPYWQGWR